MRESLNTAAIATILAAVADPEDQAQPAVARAAEIAAALGSRVLLFHAAFYAPLSGRPFFDSKRLARVRGEFVAQRTAKLERHAQELRQRGIDAQSIVVWEEPAYEAIVRAAIRDNVDLVIAGPHAASSRQAGWTLRHTDWQLLRLCPRPLLLVRSAASPNGKGCVLAALDPTHLNDKPAALDRLLLQWGASMAGVSGAELHAIHSIPAASYALGETSPEAREKIKRRTQRKLAAEVKQSQVPVAHMHVVSGNPEAAIPRTVEQRKANLLVMGAISRRGLQRLVIGDTAERIIHAVACDLLIVKPQGFKVRLGKAQTQAVIMPSVKRRKQSRAGSSS